MNENSHPQRGYFSNLLSLRCPRCREGKLFVHPISANLYKVTEMHERCPSCRQVTDIEVGFYYGTGYVSYLLAVGISIVTFLLWLIFIGFSFKDNRFWYWLGGNSVMLLLLQPYLMRFSRVLWLSFFVSYDPDWRTNPPEEPERVNKEQMGNW